MLCEKCGAQTADNAKFCDMCGTQTATERERIRAQKERNYYANAGKNMGGSLWLTVAMVLFAVCIAGVCGFDDDEGAVASIAAIVFAIFIIWLKWHYEIRFQKRLKKNNYNYHKRDAADRYTGRNVPSTGSIGVPPVFMSTCMKCGTALRENAKYCPECGVAAEPPPPPAEYNYETHAKLFPLKAAIPLFIIWLLFSAIGVLAALGSGFWQVGVGMSGIVFFVIFVAAWSNKGRQKKWGVERTLWVFTPEGYGTGYPPDVAKRLGAVGAVSAAATAAGRQNWGVVSIGVELAKNLQYVNGLPIMPWTAHVAAEYHPEKREIIMHLPNGHAGLIRTNPDNYTVVEQIVRGYMRKTMVN